MLAAVLRRFLRRARTGITYANVMATVAVFIALGGTAWAASELKKNSVAAKHLKRGAVTSPKLKNSAVTSAKILDAAVGAADLGASSVTSDKILDQTITGTDVASGGLSPQVLSATGSSSGDILKNVAGQPAWATPGYEAQLKQVVVVRHSGTDIESGTRLIAAMAAITDAAPTKPYSLLLEPGVYDLNGATLEMKDDVSLAGFNRNTTTVTSSNPTAVINLATTVSASLMNVGVTSVSTTTAVGVVIGTNADLSLQDARVSGGAYYTATSGTGVIVNGGQLFARDSNISGGADSAGTSARGIQSTGSSYVSLLGSVVYGVAVFGPGAASAAGVYGTADVSSRASEVSAYNGVPNRAIDIASGGTYTGVADTLDGDLEAAAGTTVNLGASQANGTSGGAGTYVCRQSWLLDWTGDLAATC